MYKLLLSVAIAGTALGAGVVIARRGEADAGMDDLDQRKDLQVATFAGGCFWGVEAAFEELPGVVEAVSGYTGGHAKNPTYEEVCSGKTGHTEAVRVYYVTEKTSYDDLLEAFWKKINPTRPARKKGTHGWQYRSAIFYHTAEQKREAEASRKRLQESGRFKSPIVTPIEPAAAFYPAEDYHQNYHAKNRAARCAIP